MTRFLTACCMLVVCSTSCASAVHASFESWHHYVDMDYRVLDCMESCYHVDNTGSYTTAGSIVQPNVVLGSAVVDASLNETCYGPATVHLSTEVISGRSMTVSASDSTGVGYNAAVAIGDAAKGEVAGQIGWNHSWDWMIESNYSEAFTLGAGGTVDWPQSGEREVIGSDAKISCEIKIYGDRAVFSLQARRQHRCMTTIRTLAISSGPELCYGHPFGSVVLTPYSGDGTVQFTGMASGQNPKRVSIGQIMETGMIISGCYEPG